jgi:hypothetical protein
MYQARGRRIRYANTVLLEKSDGETMGDLDFDGKLILKWLPNTV